MIVRDDQRANSRAHVAVANGDRLKAKGRIVDAFHYWDKVFAEPHPTTAY